MGLLDKLFKKAPASTAAIEATADERAAAAWKVEIAEVARLCDALEYEEALAKLEEVLLGLTDLEGQPADHMRAVTTGRIGECLLQTGDAESALARFEEAQAICERMDDPAGVRAYLRTRMETLRWLGRHTEAVPIVERLADLAEAAPDPVLAQRWRTRARVLAAGEPLLRATVEIGGAVYELDELPEPIDGTARVILERNRMTLARSVRFVQEGRDRGSASAYDDALSLFARAMDADPYDPQPRYEAAFTHALMGEYDRAVALYDEVERLAPGWFNNRSDRWLAERLEAGAFPADVLHILIELEDGVSEAEQRVEMARILTERMPKLSHGWLYLGRWLGALGRPEEAAEAFEAGLERTDEPDLRTRLLFESGALDPVSRRAHLEEAAALEGHLAAGAMAKVVLVATRR